MCLNHPKIIPHPFPVCGKPVFYETGSWCQNGWGPLLCDISVHVYGIFSKEDKLFKSFPTNFAKDPF